MKIALIENKLCLHLLAYIFLFKLANIYMNCKCNLVEGGYLIHSDNIY